MNGELRIGVAGVVALGDTPKKVRKVLAFFVPPTNPRLVTSVITSGTGVNALLPSAFLRVLNVPTPNELAAGHDEVAAVLFTHSRSEPW